MSDKREQSKPDAPEVTVIVVTAWSTSMQRWVQHAVVHSPYTSQVTADEEAEQLVSAWSDTAGVFVDVTTDVRRYAPVPF